MKDANCGYCMRGELLDKFGIFICDLKVSSLILFKEQSHPHGAIYSEASLQYVCEELKFQRLQHRHDRCGSGTGCGSKYYLG